MEKWYCWKCRVEVITEQGIDRLVHTDISVPLNQLKKDPKKRGFYLCRKHAKET